MDRQLKRTKLTI